MNVLEKETFKKLIETREGINKILIDMRPYLLSQVKKIIFNIKKIRKIVIDEDLVDEIFQNLRIVLWKAVKGYNEKRGMPFTYINNVIKSKSISIFKKIIYTYMKKKSSDVDINILVDLNSNYISKKLAREHAIKTLPYKRQEQFISLINKESLSNAKKVGLKSIISKNQTVNNAFKDYFSELLIQK